MDDKNLRAYLAEMIGTAAFVFLSAAAVCISFLGSVAPAPSTVAVVAGVVTGLIYSTALALTVPIAGGYLNPAVTIMLWVFRRLSGAKTVGLLIAQVLGSMIAGVLLYFLCFISADVALVTHLGAPQMADVLRLSSFSLVKGVGLELVLTGVVVLVVFGTALDPRTRRNPWAGRLAYLWIGMAVAAATTVGLPLTGGALNPARWLGPAAWDLLHKGSFEYHAVYWVGPIAGALLVGWVYTALILPSEEEQRTVQSHAGSATGYAGSGLARAKK